MARHRMAGDRATVAGQGSRWYGRLELLWPVEGVLIRWSRRFVLAAPLPTSTDPPVDARLYSFIRPAMSSSLSKSWSGRNRMSDAAA